LIKDEGKLIGVDKFLASLTKTDKLPRWSVFGAHFKATTKVPKE